MPGAITTQRSDNDATTSPPLRGIYHLTHPRSASNLFQNMMAKQPGFQYSGYKLFGTGFAILGQLERGPLSEWPEEDRKKMYEMFQKGFEEMQDEIEQAESEGKKILLKEHVRFLSAPDKLMSSAYKNDTVEPLILHERGAPTADPHTNPTSLPDSFLLQFQPIFQIRNPVLMFPSLVRAQASVNFAPRPQDLLCQVMLSLHALRALYDWYAEQSATSHVIPRLIDADDVMNDPATVRLLCTQTGLDPDAIVYEWEQRVVENPMHARFLSTLSNSTGIVKGLDAQGKTVESEMEKWVAEWGKENAEEMARLVREAMPDYEYLWSKRTKAGGKIVQE